jgi:hypothetical protein
MNDYLAKKDRCIKFADKEVGGRRCGTMRISEGMGTASASS